MTDVPADPAVLPDTPDDCEVVGASVYSHTAHDLAVVFTPWSGDSAGIDARVRGLTAVLDGLSPESLPACRPYLLARAQLREFDASTGVRRQAAAAELARLEEARTDAEQNMEEPDLLGRVAAVEALAVSTRREIEGYDAGRERLRAIAGRHRDAAVSAMTRAAIEQAECRRAEVHGLYEAAVATLARVAGPAALDALVLCRASEALRRTDFAAAARNFAHSRL